MATTTVEELMTLWKIRVKKEDLDKADKKIKQVEKNFQQMGERVRDVGTKMTAFVTLPILGLGAASVKAASDIETMETSFIGILGSAEKAKDMVATLNEFTAKTPFQLEQVSASAKQLLAAGIAPEMVADKLQILGDISAAANVPLNDMSAIFAKIQNKGKAMTEEILQMSDRGIPIIRLLAEQFGVAEGQIFEMASQGKISREVIMQTFKRMTEEGQFANKAMILQAKTLAGVFSTMRDNLKFAMADIGRLVLPTIKKFALAVIDLSQKFQKLSEGWKWAILIIGGLVAALGPLLLGLGTFISLIPMAIKGLGMLSGLFSLAALKVLLLIGAVIGVVLVIQDLYTFLTGGDSIIGRFIERLDELVNIGLKKFPVFGNIVRGVMALIMTPIRIVTASVRALSGALAALMEGNFSLAADALGEGVEAVVKPVFDAILGKKFSFADMLGIGGIRPESQANTQGAANQSTNVSMNAPINVNVPEGTNPEAVGPAVQRGVQDAVDGLLRQTVRANRTEAVY